MKYIKGIFKVSQVKYSGLLVSSIVVFVGALVFNRAYPEAFARVEIFVYGSVFLMSLTWSILNYVKHLEVNAIYDKHSDIESFTRKLAINMEEKEELIAYLNDYVSDLVANGSSREDAIQTAISNFQVKEFVEKEGSVLETKAHTYLLGIALILFAYVGIISMVNRLIAVPFILSAISFACTIYSVAFIALFFIYKYVDTKMPHKVH